MKSRGLIALLITSFLSCSTIPNQQNSYSPKFIVMNISGGIVSIIEDTNNDKKLDSISYYSFFAETKPGSSSDDPDDYFILKFEDKQTWASPFTKNKTQIPNYEIEPPIQHLKQDIRWSY